MDRPAKISSVKRNTLYDSVRESREKRLQVLALTALLLVFSSPTLCQPTDSDPPNIVLFFVDDLGYGHLGSYGQALIKTPRLDEMAARGLRMTHFYSGDSWCPASRNTLMSGKHSGHTQLRGVGTLEEEDPETAPLYLPGWLRRAGYATGLFGKWGLGSYSVPPDGDRPVATSGRPTHLGFDEFLGFMTHRDAHTFTLPPFAQKPGDYRIHDRLWKSVDGETVEDPRSRIPYLPDVLLDAALEFIDRHQERPFFLYLPSALPHAEYFLPKDDPAWAHYLDEQGRSVFPETEWSGNPAFRRPVPFPKATFAAMVTRLDTEVGRALDHLEHKGLAEKTLVLFISDNGPAGDAGLESPQFFNGSGGLRGLKTSLYEGGIRVPMIAYWPGTIPAGVSSEPAALWDLLPTLLELADAPGPSHLDGRSMVKLMVDQQEAPQVDVMSEEAGKADIPQQADINNTVEAKMEEPAPLHDRSSLLYWETFNWNHRSQAIRLGKWKAIRPEIKGHYDRVELYDLESDPEEIIDYSPLRSHCGKLVQLKKLMNASHEKPPPQPRGSFEVPELVLDCAHLFSDGFESGNELGWSSVEQP